MIARTKRYKLLYVIGFIIVTIQMFGNLFIIAATPVVWCVLAATMAGLGLGAAPTINTIVVQNAIPKRLLGAAVGAFFFCLMFGQGIAPAILGSAMNATYAQSLKLPEALDQGTDREIMEAVHNPNALLSETKKAELRVLFEKKGNNGEELFQQSIDTMRHSMEVALRRVFLIGAITMLIAAVLITTIPGVPIGSGEKPE